MASTWSRPGFYGYLDIEPADERFSLSLALPSKTVNFKNIYKSPDTT